MRFLAIQDRKMFTVTWNAPPHLPEARAQRTYVTVRLKPVGDNETEVSLHHGGWGDGGQWDQAYAYFDKAWGERPRQPAEALRREQALRLDRLAGERPRVMEKEKQTAGGQSRVRPERSSPRALT